MTDPTPDSWRQKIAAFSPNHIEHEVNGVPVNFYPISVGMMFRLKEIGRPLARALATLFSKNDKDQATADRKIGENAEVQIEAISEGLAKIRHEQRTEAIEGMFDSLTSDTNMTVIGEILMSSMKELFPNATQADHPPPLEFFQELAAPALTAMLIGTARANREVLGPLADQVSEKMSVSVARMVQTAQENVDVVAKIEPAVDVTEEVEAPTEARVEEPVT